MATNSLALAVAFLTLEERSPSTYDMCPICFWEDGLVQFRDPTSCCGTNGVSFAEARENFESIGFLLPRRVWERPRPFSLQDLEDAGREWTD